MYQFYEIELDSHGTKRRLGFGFINETEAKDWIKKHPLKKDESYRIVPFEKVSDEDNVSKI